MVHKIQNAGISGAHAVAPTMSRAQAEKEIGQLLAEQMNRNIVILKNSNRSPVVAKYVCFLKHGGVYQLIAEQDVAEGDINTCLLHAPSPHLPEGHIPLTVTGLLRYREIPQMLKQLGANWTIEDKRDYNYAEPYNNVFGLHQFFNNRHSHDLSDEQTIRDFLCWLNYTPRKAFYTEQELSEKFEGYVVDTDNDFAHTHLRTLVLSFVEHHQNIAGSIPMHEYRLFEPTINSWVNWHTGEGN